ncbi:MAG: phosphoethanolamine transferase, partial [Marinomonas sp.]
SKSYAQGGGANQYRGSLDNYISASANTANSLPRTLSLVQNEKIKFQYNIITLANAADFNTTWISNQGFIGKYDTAISKIAIYSHNKVFLKKGGFRSKNTNDLELLPFFDKELKRESKKPKLIVLHLMGSHPNFCDRIKKDIYNFKDKKLSCYLSSYAQTDFLIKSVIESLKRNEKTYSLVYFSDHGLNNNGTRDNVRLMHGASFKSNYEIPFIEISSDMKEEKHIKNEISAFDFMGFFEGWINVKTDKIPTFSILSKDNHSQVKVFNYHEMVTFDNLKSDPPILSPKK